MEKKDITVEELEERLKNADTETLLFMEQQRKRSKLLKQKKWLTNSLLVSFIGATLSIAYLFPKMSIDFVSILGGLVSLLLALVSTLQLKKDQSNNLVKIIDEVNNIEVHLNADEELKLRKEIIEKIINGRLK